MMHPVMRGGVEDEFNPSWKLVEGFGVQPILINKTDAQHGDNHPGVEAKQRQRHPEGILQNALTHALAERGSKVVVLRTVMRHMACPEEPHFVVAPVEGVIGKVI